MAKPIVIEKQGPHAWVMFVKGAPVVNVDGKLAWPGRKNFVEGAPEYVFASKDDAEGVAHMIGRYTMNLGDMVYSYVDYRDARLPEAEEDPCSHTHPDSVPTDPCPLHDHGECHGCGKPEVAAVAIVAEESAPVLYESVPRQACKPLKIRWHRDSKGGYVAKGRVGTYTVSKQKPNRRHSMLPLVLAVDGRPLKSFETKGAAQAFACTYDEIVPYVMTHHRAPKTGGSVHEASESSVAEEAYATIAKTGVEKPKRKGPVDGMRDVYKLLQADLEKEDQEVFWVVPLDIRDELRQKPIEVARGQRSKVVVSPTDVFRAVLVSGASSYYVIHVHPSGHSKPSAADRELTESIKKGSRVAFDDIEFRGHIVAGKNEYADAGTGKVYKL